MSYNNRNLDIVRRKCCSANICKLRTIYMIYGTLRWKSLELQALAEPVLHTNHTYIYEGTVFGDQICTDNNWLMRDSK